MKRSSKKAYQLLGFAVLTGTLAACGRGGGSNGADPTPTQVTAPVPAPAPAKAAAPTKAPPPVQTSAQAPTPATRASAQTQAEARPHPDFVTLTQTVTPRLPATAPDVVGIRIGMTVPQAEAIAAKNYSAAGKPAEFSSTLSINRDGSLVQSQRFISQVTYQIGNDDRLTLNFSNPASGNAVYSIDRKVDFYGSKRPLATVITSKFMKKYGQASSQTNQPYVHNEYKWKFGEQLLDVYEYLATDNTKLISVEMSLQDPDLQSESTTAGHNQLVAASEAKQKKLLAVDEAWLKSSPVLSGVYVPKESAQVSKLKENADNIIDITGVVTGRALVLSCVDWLAVTSYNKGLDISASQWSDYNLPNDIFKKYGLGPVTYDGERYDLEVGLIDDLGPGKLDLYAKLYPVDGKGASISGKTAVSNSVETVNLGGASGFTLDHVVLKLDSGASPNGPKVSPSATMTINGKGFCDSSAHAPLPLVMMGKSPPLGSLRFLSGTRASAITPKGVMPLTYLIRGNQVQLADPHGHSLSMTIDGHGCLNAPGGTTLCKKDFVN